MKKAVMLIIGVAITILCSMWLVFLNNTPTQPDAVAINDAVITASQSETPTEVAEILTNTIRHEYEQIDSLRRSRDIRLLVLLSALVVFVIVITLAGFSHINQTILKPFMTLKSFARNVASGNLDIPLEMDKSGSFGAFTESFDLMREELKHARENERAADRSKKELVASLSHDIKTPIASIKATVELMQITAVNEKEQSRLKQIDAKAEQINTLVTDIFHSTLQELEELQVSPIEVHSTIIPDLIKNADHKERINPFAIPPCIIIADPIRLQQLFDNIIGNSYKYADTDITIIAEVDGSYLVITLSDSGAGVSPDDLPLLTTKFYRGKNALEKSGYGLGLYICSYLITQMSGEMFCENTQDGFSVTIKLRLAGK